jgi:hypothetical protein
LFTFTPIENNKGIYIMNLKPVIREEDNELLGFVKELAETAQWQALTVFKYPLQVFETEREAEEKIQSIGLEILMDKWFFHDATLNEWFGCQIIEASPERVKYRITDLGHPQVYKVETIVAPNPTNFKTR